jgi:phosphohistidine phosphatase SixA
MTALHLLRHAHAGDPEAWDGPDASRPLSDKGRAQSERLGRLLADRHFRPDLLLTSPKLRALQTAQIVADRLGVPVVVEDRLGGPLDEARLEAILADHGDPSTPLLVGHDPDFTELVEALSGATNVPMRKGALARIDVERPVRSGGGILRWLVPPDLLKPER